MSIKVSEVERLLLVNQFRLLALSSDKDERESLERSAEIFERGYVANYGDALGQIRDWKELSEEQSQHVLDVLNMFTAIRNAKEDGIAFPDDPRMALSYAGFEDASHSLYAKFLIEKMGRYEWLKDPNWNLPTTWKYLPMLAIWRALPNSMKLGTADLAAMATAVEKIK